MADERFIDEQPIEGTNQVTKVWDATFLLPRAVRALAIHGPEEAEAIRERVRLLARVRHPALPPLVAVGEDEESVRLVESWVDGRSLSQMVDDNGSLSLTRTLGLLSPVIDALRSAHELGIGHGGIDTRSVMVDQVGVPQLVGLGARAGEPTDDVADLGLLMKEVIAEPWPDTLRSVIDEATGGQLDSLPDVAERLRLISVDLSEADDDSELDFDFDFDFEFDPDEVVYDEAAVASDRRVLAMVALGVLAIICVGIYGTFLPDPEELAEATDVDLPEEILAEADEPTDGSETLAEDAATPDETPEAMSDEPPPMPEAEVPPDPETPEVEEEPAPDGPDEAPIGAEIELPPALADMDVPAGGGPSGKWQLKRASEAPAMAVLDAENEVADRLDRMGRPQLALVCGDDGLTAQLRPGVRRVEATADERTYEIYTMLELSQDGLPAAPIRANLVHHDGHVYLPLDRVRSLADVSSLVLRYPVFAGDPVVALFDVRGLDVALGELARCG